VEARALDEVLMLTLLQIIIKVEKIEVAQCQ